MSKTATRNPLFWFIIIGTGLSTFLLWLIYFSPGTSNQPDWVVRLPAANAFFNAMCACCLVFGYINIRRGKREVHQRAMIAAFFFSILFLSSYVTYHHFHGDTPFPGQGLVRVFYFTVLASHIVLSIIALPMVLTTLFYAATQNFTAHKKLARYTLPVWLYVSVTGVLVFFLLRAHI